jgi:hypothetical protein
MFARIRLSPDYHPRDRFRGRKTGKLLGDVAQGVARYRVQLTIRTEEAHNSFGLLEWLNQAIQQNAIETVIMPTDAILVVLVERVHNRLPPGIPAGS